MKQILYTALFVSLAAIGCGEKSKSNSVKHMIAQKDVEGLKEKQERLQKEYKEVTQKLAEIRDALEVFDNTKQLPIVTVFTVKDTIFQHIIEVQGSVDTKNNTMLFSEFPGVLTHIYVKKGQHVKKGELVAKVGDGGLSQQLAQAKVRYGLSKVTYERQSALWKKKIGSEIQYLQVKANMEAAARSVAHLDAQLAKATIRAPFSGIIDDVPAKEGTVVLPGQTAIARLVNLDNMYVRADLSESYLSKIKKGTPVQILFPAIGEELTSKVRQVGNFINPNNRTFYIEIGVPNKEGNIKPNLMATLKMSDYENVRAKVVPENIVQEDSKGNSFVYILQNDGEKKMVHRVQIKKGLTQGVFVEVKEGLEKGMLVIDEGNQGMQEGLVVEVKGAA